MHVAGVNAWWEIKTVNFRNLLTRAKYLGYRSLAGLGMRIATGFALAMTTPCHCERTTGRRGNPSPLDATGSAVRFLVHRIARACPRDDKVEERTPSR